MTFTEMEQAVSEARATLNRADCMIPAMLKMIKGRMRNIRDYQALGDLADIKKELRDFNPQRREWKKP